MPVYKYLPASTADRLRNFNLFAKKAVVGLRQGLHKSPMHGSSVEFAEYREYMPGDPPSLIDWAVYARSDRYTIRKFQEETNVKAYILVDISESMLFKEEGLCNKMEYAFYLAAGLMYILIHQGDLAGMMTFSSKLQKVFEPVGSLDALRPILTEMESTKPSGRSNLESCLYQATQRIPGRSMVVLISDFLEETSSLFKGVHSLCHNGVEVILLHILDLAEIRLPFEGVLEMEELESKEKMVVDIKEIQESYKREVEAYLHRMRNGAMESMAGYHFLETQIPIEQSLSQIILW